MNKFSEKIGELSKEQMILLGIAGVVLIAVFILLSGVLKQQPPSGPPPSGPVYEVELEDKIRFKLQEVKDRGDILRLTEAINPKAAKKDATTSGRFIEVTVSVYNIGKDNIKAGTWGLKDLYDSNGAKFYSSTFYNLWVSGESQCGVLLKPQFPPILCSKIYEVSKVSTGLKVGLYFKDTSKQAFIDLGL